jgi:hypothetical protein
VDPVRHVHSWRGPDLPNLPLRRPLALFDQLFGAGAADARRRRARASVLDTVIEAYRRATSPASGHGPAERALIAEHLETLRALERRAQALEARAAACPAVTAPPDLDPDGFCRGDGCPPEHAGVASWDEVWATNVALTAVGLRCDLFRHASLTCTGAGDRYNLPFLDTMVHVLAHAFRPEDQRGFVLAVRWVMDRVAVLLRALDDASRPEPDGGTLLDRTLVLVGTELADPVTHGFDDMSYLIAGGGVRGGAVDVAGASTDVDVFRTFARAAGVAAPFGDDRLVRRPLPDLL